jgi:hypothetical protein
MSAGPLRIMAFGHQADPGGSHAPAPSYPQPLPGPSLRHQAPATARPAARLQAEGLRPDPLGRPARRRRRRHLDPRRLRAARRPRLRGDDPQGTLRLAAGVRRIAAAAQRRLGRPIAPGAGPSGTAAGHRPDLDPLSRGSPSATPRRSTAAWPRTAPAISMPMQPPTSCSRGSDSPSR